MNIRTVLSVFIAFGALAVMSSVSSAATVTGSVKYDGEAPKFRDIKMDADPICLSFHSGSVAPQTLVLGEGNMMANVFIQVKSGLPRKDYPAPAEPVVIDQKGCMYEPHVAGVLVGQTLKILNPDGTLHNVHSLSKINPEFNLAMPKFRAETTKVFDKPEFMFPMKCDVHPWMSAWVTVMAHPFFSVTKPDGKFTIENLPAGTYELEAWHEKLGTQTATVTVADGDAKEINFTFTRPTEK
jgi:plastocyanin